MHLDNLPRMMRQLPSAGEQWQLNSHHSGSHKTSGRHLKTRAQEASRGKGWKWPKRPVFFISDPHADAEAFLASLLSTGGIEPPKRHDRIRLTKSGKKALFVIGGDCLDKGPSNLRLLESIKALYDAGAKVTLIAGNHDIRLLMGLLCLEGKKDVLTEHLFVRMGNKVVPLLAEVFERFVKNKKRPKKLPSIDACRRILYPRNDWFARFPMAVSKRMPDEAIVRELERMGKKIKTFEATCLEYGMTLQDVYLTAQICRKLFLKPKGEFGWFFKRMILAEKMGSFIFLHAGLDDSVAKILEKKGVKALNSLYHKQLKRNLFEFYFGTVANVMRTKYRAVDLPLSPRGVRRVHKSGVHAVVQGHLNRKYGQRIVLKEGLIHIEGDITLDRNSRRKEGLRGLGAGHIQICPKGQIIGVSNDYPRTKIFSLTD
jgi:hypothetical protein